MFKNFSFSWFLTIPGMLTGVGCLLVIISIIIFISTLKDKKKKNNEADVNVAIPDQGVNSVPIDNDGNPLNGNNTSANIVDNQAPLTSGIDQINVIPVENNFATDVQPVEVAPVNMEPQIQPVEPTVNNNVQVDAVKLPYGGVSPTVSVPLGNDDQEKVIYGGADPLVGTGVIPVVQSVQPEVSKNDDIEAL